MNQHTRTKILEALSVLVPFALLAWLNGRADANPLRWSLAGTILLLTLAFLWKNRRSLWRPLLIVLLSGLALGLLFMTSPDASSQWVEDFTGKALSWYFIASLSWLYLRLVLPKAATPHQAPGILHLGLALSISLLIISLLGWLTAVDLYALPKTPLVTTGPELKAQWDAPYGTRHNGIFAVGIVGDPSQRDLSSTAQSSFLAYYYRRTFGISSSDSIPHNYLPGYLDFTLADGTKISIQGVNTVRKTSNWPKGGPHLWQYGLRHGDPVVIWADPGHNTLLSPRVIAYGSLNDFHHGYLARTVKTARLFGWIAFALIPLSLIPGILGFLRWKALRQLSENQQTSSSKP